MINTHVKVFVMDFASEKTYGYRNIFIDNFGTPFIKFKGKYRELFINNYAYYEEKGRVYVDLENNIVY